uniref:Sirohydrochlorin cobaltochelatase n=1 Tax=Lygus hesperus TaxID=30085 RepID=A0A0A9XCG7_LYGHE
MVIETRKSHSASNIGSIGTCNKGVRPSRKLNTQRGTLGRAGKAQGQITTHVKMEKSDSNLTSAVKTTLGGEKMRLNGAIVGKNNETPQVKHGVIQGFSKMVPLQEIHPIKSNYGIKGGRKSSFNNEIRKVTSKKEIWPKKSLDASGKRLFDNLPPQRAHSKTFSSLKTPLLDDTKTTEGRRTVLRMPANIPKAGRKQRYNIAVVGTEIKLVDTKNRMSSRLTSIKSFASSSPFRKIPMSRKNARVRAKRRKKTKKVKESSRESCRNESVECSLDQTGDGLAIDLNRSELSEVVGLPSDRERLRRVYKFSDRRTKAEVTTKASQACTGEEILLDRLDPISNILSTELVDSAKRCQSIIDFVTAPIENPNPPFIMKQVFYDTTVMEELNFPHLTTADLSGNGVPELKLVPTYLPVRVKKSLSFPDLAIITPKFASRSLCLPGRRRKRKPKIETILATRPKGFQHAKWLEKTVGPDSTLKSKLLQDVIISQVRKCLKRQAELRQKLQANTEMIENRSSKAYQENYACHNRL